MPIIEKKASQLSGEKQKFRTKREKYCENHL